MKNTCAQSGKCSVCGKNIHRYSPTQKWMANGSYSEICIDSDDGNHHLAARN